MIICTYTEVSSINYEGEAGQAKKEAQPERQVDAGAGYGFYDRKP